MSKLAGVAVASALALAALALSAGATAPPIGPVPKGPVTSIQVQHGQLFAMVLPKPKSGYAWRGKSNSNSKVARPLDEGELNGNIVLVYKAAAAGKATVVYALTQDEQAKAYQSQTFKVTVS